MPSSLRALLRVVLPIVTIFFVGCGGGGGGEMFLDSTPPTVPADLTATAVSAFRIDLSWSESTDAVGYKIYRNDMFHCDVFGATTFQDLNLASRTTYEYRASAYDSAGNESVQSALASATTMAGTMLLGTSGYDGAQGVAIDGSGSIYVTGWTLGDLDGNTNAGVADILLAKYDSSGVKQWTRLMGGSVDDLALGVAADGNGNTYIAGRTRDGLDGNPSAGGWDAFLTKYDSFGTRQWTRLLGSPGDDGAYGVTLDGSGNVYISGSTESYSGLDGIPSSGGSDAFLAKYDSAGTKQWTRLLGSPGNDLAFGASADSSGNIYITGYTGGDLGGNANAGGVDVFLTKYDSSGNTHWTDLLGTMGDDGAWGVGVDSSGNIYITGFTEGDLDGNANAGYQDAFVAKYDSSGTKRWTRLLGSPNNDIAYGVTVDGAGNIYTTGLTRGNLDGNTSAGYQDAFLARYDSSGTKQWTRLLGSSEDDIAYGAAADGTGNIYVAGITDGNLDGNTNAGDYDIFWTRYSPDGVKQ